MKHLSKTWKKKDGNLYKKYTFSNFKQAMSFVNKIANYAEKVGHHPELRIGYSTVEVYLKSHDVNKITKKDVTSAKHYDELIKGDE